MLRFRDLGVYVFELWVLRFRLRVLRFRDLGASCCRLDFSSARSLITPSIVLLTFVNNESNKLRNNDSCIFIISHTYSFVT